MQPGISHVLMLPRPHVRNIIVQNICPSWLTMHSRADGHDINVSFLTVLEH